MIATTYLQRLTTLLRGVRCTRNDGSTASLDDAVRAAVGMIRGAHAAHATVACIGNGGSATMASHLAEDLLKLRGVRAMTFGDAGMLTCLGNDCGFEDIFDVPVGIFIENGDILVAISSSGLSENVLRAAWTARQKVVGVITLTGFCNENPLQGLGDVNFHIPEHHYGLVESAHAAILHCLVDCWGDE